MKTEPMIAPSSPRDRLDALIAFWRQEAADHEAPCHEDDRPYHDLRAMHYREGADEVEAALGVREAVLSLPHSDIREIVSSYGFLLMRLAVAEDAQDVYNVCKREFESHEAALTRLQDAFLHVSVAPPEGA